VCAGLGGGFEVRRAIFGALSLKGIALEPQLDPDAGCAAGVLSAELGATADAIGADSGATAAARLTLPVRPGLERSGELVPTPCLPFVDIARRRASAASRPLDFRFALLAMFFAVGFVSVDRFVIGAAGYWSSHVVNELSALPARCSNTEKAVNGISGLCPIRAHVSARRFGLRKSTDQTRPWKTTKQEP
ncbi:MAG TPA: hypothetical protein DDY14_16195, partial [Chromatiaceae bacterium]|nr:hypothetical protein [Chromatiaceae bacterium]